MIIKSVFPNFKKINIIFWVVGIAFIIRFFFFIVNVILNWESQAYLLSFHAADTPTYLKPAIELLNTGRFTTDGIPEVFRTPGYSIFLIPGILLGHPELFTIFLQFILSCWTIYLVYRISLLVFKVKKAAIFASCLLSIEPLSIILANRLLTETLFTSLFIAFVYQLILYLKNKSIREIIFAGLFLVASTFVRPITYYLPYLIFLMLIIYAIKNFNHRKIVLFHAILFLVISVSPLYLWQLRNKIETGYTGFCSIQESHLYYWHASSVLSAKYKLHFREVWDYIPAKINNEISKEDQKNTVKINNYFSQESKRIIFSNPFIYLSLRINGILNLLFNSVPWQFVRFFKLATPSETNDMFFNYLTEFFHKGFIGGVLFYFNQVPLPIFLIWLLLEILILIYMALMFKAILTKQVINQFYVIVILCLVTYLTILAGGPDGASTRFRTPIMPLICILAGYGLFLLIEPRTNKNIEKISLLEQK